MITFSFKDKVVLIAGSQGGVGKAVVKLFQDSGATVVELTHKNMEITDPNSVRDAVKKILETYHSIDYLVNCVGMYVDGDEWNMSEEAWKKTLDINLLGAMYLSKEVGQHFVEQKKGVIVNIASRLAVLGDPEDLAYSASKAGLVSLTQSYAQLLAPFGRANAISPTAIRAGYWLHAPQEEIESNLNGKPMKRFIEPSEIASLVAYLCSDESAMITGQNIVMDGGHSFR